MSNDEDTDLMLSLGLSLDQARAYLAIPKLEKNYGWTGARDKVDDFSFICNGSAICRVRSEA